MTMNRKKSLLSFLLAFLLVFLAGTSSLMISNADSATTNRFNVMIVMDASGSMDYTDPSELRHEAVNLFTYLLADEGNNVGGVVFSTDVLLHKEPKPISNKNDKTEITTSINSVNTETYTNIGAALNLAVKSIKENGDPNIPSVIVMLSDGVTDCPTKEDLEKSLEEKANAIQEARDSNIPIYTVCLNADQTADTSEMMQIAKATNGKFQEVNRAEDLKAVFNTFYNLIYGTSTVRLAEDTFPENGIIEKDFIVPAFGVEEINIIVNGNTEDVLITKPNGKICEAEELSAKTFTVYKTKETDPGTWNIKTKGKPGDKIEVDMVFNNDLTISLDAKDIEFENGVSRINPKDPITFVSKISSGGMIAQEESDYKAYSAILHILNSANDVEVGTIPMNLVGNQFELSTNLEEGKYSFYATLVGDYLDGITSSKIGTIVVTSEEMTNEEKNNTPPIPVESPVEITVKRWPFKDNTYSLDLNTLATDEQDEVKGIPLEYAIISTSFLDEDYTVENGVLSVKNYSLSKGSFDIRATDSGGLSCNVEVIVKSINIGLITVILMAVGILIGLIVLGLLTYIALGKPFMGRIKVENISTREQKTAQKNRGRLSLKSFQIGQTGIDGYFQASGKNYVDFKSKKPIYTRYSTKPQKSIRINSGMDVEVSNSSNFDNPLLFRFESMLPSIPGGGGTSLPPRKKKRKLF